MFSDTIEAATSPRASACRSSRTRNRTAASRISAIGEDPPLPLRGSNASDPAPPTSDNPDSIAAWGDASLWIGGEAEEVGVVPVPVAPVPRPSPSRSTSSMPWERAVQGWRSAATLRASTSADWSDATRTRPAHAFTSRSDRAPLLLSSVAWVPQTRVVTQWPTSMLSPKCEGRRQIRPLGPLPQKRPPRCRLRRVARRVHPG